MTDTAPGYMKKQFACPHCGTVADQWWGELLYEHTGFRLSEADVSICANCHGQAIWVVNRHDDPPSAKRVHPS